MPFPIHILDKEVTRIIDIETLRTIEVYIFLTIGIETIQMIEILDSIKIDHAIIHKIQNSSYSNSFFVTGYRSCTKI